MKYLLIFLCVFTLICSCKDKPKEPYKIPEYYVEQLKQAHSLRFTTTIDSCKFVASPYWGSTVGIEYVHHPACKNKIHAK